MRVTTWARNSAAALVLAAVLLSGTPATAGCLAEYNGCSDCARSSLRKAVRNFSLAGIRAADIEFADCAIDLWHCLIFDSHHRYPCAL